jgi:hypothetical protein
MEHIMRRFIVVIVSLAFPIASMAQQVLQCVNPDVLNSLVFNGRAESRLVIRRGMPDIVAGFRAPSGFTLIGNGMRGQGNTTVVGYRTTLERDKAFDSLLGFMFDEGWSREAPAQPQLPAVTVAGPQPTSARLCRNGERRNLMVQEIEGIRYATISGFETTPPRACGAPAPQLSFGVDPQTAMNAARAIMPQFSFPATARLSGSPGGTSISGGTWVTSATRIESPDSATTLARDLARQLREQGWRSDAEWKGSLSTGSTWMRRNDAGQAYGGTLEILTVGDGVYEVGYSAVTRRQ